MKPICILLVLLFLGLPYALAQQAQQGAADDTDTLVKQTQNPVASLISVPFQNNLNYPIGPFARDQNVLDIQPVIPMGISQKWNLLTRAILPVINRQDPLREGGTRAGLGDLNVTFFLSPAKPGKIIWGVGPVLLLPTATASVLGTDKWAAGPSVVALVQPEGWTIGLITNNVWSLREATIHHGRTRPVYHSASSTDSTNSSTEAQRLIHSCSNTSSTATLKMVGTSHPHQS